MADIVSRFLSVLPKYKYLQVAYIVPCVLYVVHCPLPSRLLSVAGRCVECLGMILITHLLI